jgi:Leucine-rich repeat (LRR) protein
MQVSNSISDAPRVHVVEIKLCTIAESTIIEYNLKRFASMTHLDLRGNKIKSSLVLASFPTTLEHLDLGGNHFQTLEGTPFLDRVFPALRYVGFAAQITELGRLSMIEPGFFSGLGNVIELDLIWSDFDLQSKGFIGLDKAELIDLKESDIGIVYENAFVGLPELTTLDLTNTRVKEYRLGCFNGTNIQDLTVEITYKDGNIDPKLFDSMPSLKKLTISRSGSGLTGAQPKINMTNVYEIVRRHPNVTVEVYDRDNKTMQLN